MNLKLSQRYQEEAGSDGGEPGGGAGGEPGEGGKPAEGLMGKAAAEMGGEGDHIQEGDEGDEATGRPAGIPENFWIKPEGEEPGKVNTEAMLKSMSDTRQELKALKSVEGKEAPEKAEDYAFTPPTETEVKYDNMAEDDPGMNAIRLASKAAGLDQAQFQTLVETFFENCTEALPDPFNEEAELALVGKNGKAVLDANVRWCMDLMEKGVISQQEYDEAMLMGATGYGVRFLAKVRGQATGELAIPLDAVEVDGALPSKEELHAQMGDPRYANEPAFRKTVDDNFLKVYGDAPAGSSVQNMGISHTNTPPANIRRADELRKKAAG